MDTTLNDDMVAAALGDLDSAGLDSAGPDSADLSPATVMALRLADVLTSDTPIVTPEFKQELGQHFSDDQILELGSALAVASGWQRFIEAFGIRPDSWTADAPPVVRPT
jgi:alkylhydroperoxidase family enzyme